MNKKIRVNINYLVFGVIVLAFLYYATPILQGSVIGEDGYIALADSETVITGAWNCIGIYGDSLNGKYSCTSKYITVIHEYTQERCSFNCPKPKDISTKWESEMALITGSDTNFKTRENNQFFLNQDLKYKYFRTTFSENGKGCGDPRGTCGSTTIYLTDCLDVNGCNNRKTIASIQGDSNSVSIDLYVDPLQPNILAVLINGEKTQEIDVNSWSNVYITWYHNSGGDLFTGIMKNPRYQLMYGCTKPSNAILGHITYVAGQTISLGADGKLTDIGQNLISFCSTHQAIVTTSTGSGESLSAYQTLSNGDPLVVGDGQTLTIFGVFDSTGLKTNCNEDSYNFKTKTCEDISGVIDFIRQGTVDLDTGTVIVESQVVCTVNGVPSGVYFSDTDSCIAYKDSMIECKDAAKGYVYSATYDKCVKYVDSTDQCTDADATITYDDNGKILCTKSVDTLIYLDATAIDDTYCQENYGDNYKAKLNKAGTAYGCVAYEISKTFFCNGVELNEGDVCSDSSTISGVELETQDVSEPATSTGIDYTLLVVILLLLGAVLYSFKLRSK